MSKQTLQTFILLIMKKDIKIWLEDTKRTMEKGIEIFAAVAPKDLRAKYLQYFQDNKNAKAHSAPYGMLINKLTFIQRNNLYSPVEVKATVNEQKVASNKAALNETRPLTDLDIVPEELKAKADRIREIVPIMAALTAKNAEPNLPIAEAKEISEEIINLETERRELWKAIDDAQTVQAPSKPENEIEVVLPQTMAEKKKAIKNLKEKINRNKKAAEKATDEEKRQNSLDLVEKYTKELDLVEAAEVAE